MRKLQKITSCLPSKQNLRPAKIYVLMDEENGENGVHRTRQAVDREMLREELLEILNGVPAFRAALRGASDPTSDRATTCN